MEPQDLAVGSIVQLGPEAHNPAFRFCLAVVSEMKSFGAQVYVQALGDRETHGGRGYYRARWEEMEPTGGNAVWLPAHMAEREGKTE